MVTRAEITPVPGTHGTMHHLRVTMRIVIMVIPVHVMNTPPGAIVFPLTAIVMDTVVDVTETTQIIQVEVPTEIRMRVMVRIHFEDHAVICMGFVKPDFYGLIVF